MKKRMNDEFDAWFESVKGKLSDDPATALYDTLQHEYYGIESDTDSIIHGSTGAGKVCVDVLGNTIQEWMDLADIAEIGNFDYGAGKKINGEVLTQAARLCTKMCFPVEPDTEYTIECSDYEVEVYYATADFTFISYTIPSWGYKRRVLNTPNDCHYIRVLARKLDNTAIGTIQGKLRLSCVTEPSIENPLMLESAGDQTNLMDNITLQSLPYESGTSKYKKKKIALKNGIYTCSIKENKFFGSGFYVLLTDDLDYNGGTSASEVYWLGHSDSKDYCYMSATFEVKKGFICLAISGLQFSDDLFLTMLPEFQIEKGNIRHSYIPYGKYGIDINSSGKNLVDIAALASADLATETSGWAKIKVRLKNGKYTWSIKENIFLGKNAYAVLTNDPDYTYPPKTGFMVSWIGDKSLTNNCATSRSFTVTNGAVYLAFYGADIPQSKLPDFLPEFQIEYGEKKTSYEAYQEDTQTLEMCIRDSS